MSNRKQKCSTSVKCSVRRSTMARSMSSMGQSRLKTDVRIRSVQPPITESSWTSRHFAFAEHLLTTSKRNLVVNFELSSRGDEGRTVSHTRGHRHGCGGYWLMHLTW